MTPLHAGRCKRVFRHVSRCGFAARLRRLGQVCLRGGSACRAKAFLAGTDPCEQGHQWDSRSTAPKPGVQPVATPGKLFRPWCPPVGKGKMNIALLLLALTTFTTGTAENIVIGILPDVASGLGVSVGFAGQLTADYPRHGERRPRMHPVARRRGERFGRSLSCQSGRGGRQRQVDRRAGADAVLSADLPRRAAVEQ